MPEYRVTITESITVEADSETEAKSVADEVYDLFGPDTKDVEVTLV